MFNKIKSLLIGSTLLFSMVPVIPTSQMDTMRTGVKAPVVEPNTAQPVAVQPSALNVLRQKVLNIPAAAFREQLINPAEGKHGCFFGENRVGTYPGSNICVATTPLIFPPGTKIETVRVYYNAYKYGKQGEEIWDQACILDVRLHRYDLSSNIPIGSSVSTAVLSHNPNPENNFLELAGEKMSETGVNWLEARISVSTNDVFCLVTGAQVYYTDQ